MDRTDLPSSPPPDQGARSTGLRRLPRGLGRAVLPTALVLGLTGDLLLQGSQGPGLNILLFFVALALAIRAATRMAGVAPSREAWSWMIAGVLLGSAFVLRASPDLQALAFLTASAAFALPALRAGAAWMWKGGVSDMVEAVAGAVAYAGLGAFRLAADGPSRGSAPVTSGSTRRRRVAAVLRGLLLAAPLRASSTSSSPSSSRSSSATSSAEPDSSR